MRLIHKTALSLVLSASIAASVVSSPAMAASSENKRYTHPDCENASTAVCGVIIYAVATTSYYVDWAEVKAKSSQPDSQDTHPSCAGVDKRLTSTIAPTNYDTFVLPASCAYKLKIKIKSGNAKDMDLFLTPGCQIVTSTKGTTVSNSWKSNDVSWMNGASGTPVDANGHKCGKLGGAGL
ncbi:MAG: hypothetical protein AAFO63_09085 [Pseudomonadota bacterium]